MTSRCFCAFILNICTHNEIPALLEVEIPWQKIYLLEPLNTVLGLLYTIFWGHWQPFALLYFIIIVFVCLFFRFAEHYHPTSGEIA